MFINGWTKETVIKHIEKNFKGKAYDCNEFSCMYKTGKKKCAVGLFIPDGHPGQKVNGSVGLLLSSYPDLEKYMPMGLIFLKELQDVHDNGFASNPDSDSRSNAEVLMDLVSYIESLN